MPLSILQCVSSKKTTDVFIVILSYSPNPLHHKLLMCHYLSAYRSIIWTMTTQLKLVKCVNCVLNSIYASTSHAISMSQLPKDTLLLTLLACQLTYFAAQAQLSTSLNHTVCCKCHKCLSIQLHLWYAFVLVSFPTCINVMCSCLFMNMEQHRWCLQSQSSTQSFVTKLNSAFNGKIRNAKYNAR